jgi:hypothetical protein
MLLVVDLPNERKVLVTENGITLVTAANEKIHLVQGRFGEYLSEEECERIGMALYILKDRLSGTARTQCL